MTATSSGKHSPARRSQYFNAHYTVMEQYERNGFVDRDGLEIERAPGGYLMEGVIECEGDIRLDVHKRIIVVQDADDPLIQTQEYRYNAHLRGEGVILRYDGPHPGHRTEHHVHRFDVLSDDSEEEIEFLHNEEDRPTLGEVIGELEEWYYDNFYELRRRGFA